MLRPFHLWLMLHWWPFEIDDNPQGHRRWVIAAYYAMAGAMLTGSLYEAFVSVSFKDGSWFSYERLEWVLMECIALHAVWVEFGW